MGNPTKYDPKSIEPKWYDYWINHQFFRSIPDHREPFTILIPPPNVTGVLHMGHMLNNTIQDVLIRHARMQGKNACWVPGTDHASIATEAKVVALLKSEGKSKHDLSREEFLQKAYEWKEKYGSIILDQLKKLGASCDWSRTRFTMEPKLNNAVIHAFVDLYNKGKIYRGRRMTNWDPVAKTVLSSEEVIYKEENSQLFHIRYRASNNPQNFIIIATQRPETIMADSAIAVHPHDPRYTHWIGQKVLIPIINKPINVIADHYVDPQFGTGALKITPAHDQNDYEIGLRHHLEFIDILDENAHLNLNAQILVGQDRFTARKNIIKLLQEVDAIEKIEPYKSNVGRSERTDAVVEPRLTLQWFLNMKQFAQVALDAVLKKEIKFFPEHFINMYQSWLKEDNIRDWCISRQLWWGQRIPAWFFLDQQGKEQVVVAHNISEAISIVRDKYGLDLQENQLCQDEDVVDTWFSSWLWPLSVFDAFEDNKEFSYYYPTNVLVTGWDIMFFWVARMIMAGYEWSPSCGADPSKGFQPFKNVYFTGMVRDNKRRKMSKSLGNSPDALALIDAYGADGVRFGMLASSSAGNDIIFDAPFDPKSGHVLNESKLCEQGRNFCNKLWNANRAIYLWESSENIQPAATSHLATDWFEERLLQAIQHIEQLIDQYRFSDAIMELYKLIWDDFCSWYIELVKPPFGQQIHAGTKEKVILHFQTCLELLHPFMPFITEELWQQLRPREKGSSICISSYPSKKRNFNQIVIHNMEMARDLITQIRALKNQYKYPQKEKITISIKTKNREFYQIYGPLIQEMAVLDKINLVTEKPENTIVFIAGLDECYFPTSTNQNSQQEEIEKLAQELQYQEGFLKSVLSKLDNETFRSKAPQKVIDMELKKKADAEQRIEILKKSLGMLDES